MTTEPDTLPAADTRPNAVDLVSITTALRCAAYTAYTLALDASHRDPRAYRWFKDVEEGQLVIETSTIFHRSRDAHGIGWLTGKTVEPYPVGDDWGDEPVPMEDVWYIKCFDGNIYRWTNADFVRVPESVSPWRQAAKPSSGGAEG